MRTDSEKKEFAEKCLEIEKAGGDVLGYIEINWPSYTPRATWYNLQHQYLNRGRNHFTEGKIDRKEGENMKRNMQTVYEGAMAVLNANGDPIAYLSEQGYKNPSMAWHDLKEWAKKHGFEVPPNMKPNRTGIRKKIAVTEPEEVWPSEHPSEPEKAPETPVKVGVGYTKEISDAAQEEYRKKHPIQTCCAPSTAKGVTVPDDLPDEEDLAVVAVKSEVIGKWEKAEVSEPSAHLVWNERLESCLSLTAEQWMRLSKEIPKALKQLGLI